MSCFRSLSLEGIEKVFLVFRIQVVSKADLFNLWVVFRIDGLGHFTVETSTYHIHFQPIHFKIIPVKIICYSFRCVQSATVYQVKRNILDGHQSSLYFTSNSPFSLFLITISANYFKSIPLKRIQNFNLFYKMRRFVLNFKYSSVSV